MRTPRRLWWKTGLAVSSGVLLVLTLITREWIEVIFGVDPDHGNGSAEWGIVLGLVAVTLMSTMLATRDWRRHLAERT